MIDSTWLAAPPAAVAPIVADSTRWAAWWPSLPLRITERRGRQGVRWIAGPVSDRGGRSLTGTAEVWLQPSCGGTVAHVFLRLDPADGRAMSRRRAARVESALRRDTKRAFWALADQLDPDRMRRHVDATHAEV